MKSPNDNILSRASFTASRGSVWQRTAAAIAAGGVIALAGILPVSAAPTTTAKKTTTVHHTTAKRHTTATRKNGPKDDLISKTEKDRDSRRRLESPVRHDGRRERVAYFGDSW